MTIHQLKCWPDEYQAIIEGRKTFEFRRNDRGFEVGDIIQLDEWKPETENAFFVSGSFTLRSVRASITYILNSGEWSVPDGYCILSIKLIPDAC